MKATDRELQEIVARCVAGMVFYQNSEKTRHAETQLLADVGAIAAWATKASLRAADIDASIIAPVEAELVARFGPEDGGRLHALFAKALRGKLAARNPGTITTGLLGTRV